MFENIEQLFDEIDSKGDDKIQENYNSGYKEDELDVLDENNKSLDNMIDSLSSDVTGATNFITDIMKEKDKLKKEKELFQEKYDKFLNEKNDFDKIVLMQNQKIAHERDNFEDYLRIKKESIKSMEEEANLQIKNDRVEVDSLKLEVELERKK